MIKNYLKIAWRNLLKHKTFSFINILGLAIGIAACMIIFLYVRNELTFDQYNVKADRIARITTTLHAPESDVVVATCPIRMAEVLTKDYPEVESTVRLENSPQVMKLSNELFREESFYKADQTVFSIFSFAFLEGSAKDALKNPHSIVITETIARKYFPQYVAQGTKSALGKIMICNGENLLVTGVVADRPTNSDIHIDALLSTEFSSKTWMDDFDVYTFVLFNKKPDLKNFERKLSAVGAKYIQPELNATGDNNYKIGFSVEPLSDVHFSQGKLLDTPKGNKQFNYVFSLLAIFILIIALLNYINLSTAKSTERAKEVGIRKVSGAQQFQLVKQFLFESFLLVTIAWLLAIGLVQIVLPFFNKLLQTNLTIHWGQSILFMAFIFLAALLLGGLYPAFVLSGFRPVEVLKGSWRHNTKGVLLRKIVTVTQFAIAAALIMGTTVIYNQMQFIRQKDLGFNKEQLLNIYLPRDSVHTSSVKVFQNELRQRPEIQDITVGSGMAMATMSGTIASSEGKKRELMCVYFSIDQHFLSVFQMHLLEGRNLSDSFGTDKNEGFLVNEAFVKAMGWKSAVGKPVEGFFHKGKIVGVVKNFYYQSLHNLVEPLVMVWNNSPENINITTVRIKSGDLPIVKALYKNNFPAIPFDYSFFDETMDKQYAQDRMTMSLFNDFTILAIFVSCLGLYGLVALIAVQRTKEIGIRKILGASLQELLFLLTKDFVKLVFVALIIALPVAGIAMNKWLSSYAYHIQLSWWMFLIPSFLVLVIALIVISREIIKTSLANPVRSLRSE